jgi:hypothetical protein
VESTTAGIGDDELDGMRCQHLESYSGEELDRTHRKCQRFAVNMRPGICMCFEDMAKDYVRHGMKNGVVENFKVQGGR